MIERDKGGDTTAVEALPPLTLIVGELDHAVWRDLEPGHPQYDRFSGAYFLQEDWDWASHAYFWDVNLALWPTDLRYRSTSGLTARHVVYWRRAGYSRTQIACALSFEPGGVTAAIWHKATSYLEWLAERPFVHPTGTAAMYELEDGYAAAWERQGQPGSADRFRRHYRSTERTPRVVAVDDRTRGFNAFGHPEGYSTAYLDRVDPSRSAVRANLARADEMLRREQPAGEAKRLPRRPRSSFRIAS